MAVIIIQLLIMAIIIRNRIESRHGKFILFRKMGMTRGKLLGICMREALRGITVVHSNTSAYAYIGSADIFK